MAGVAAAQSSSLPQIDFSSLGTVAVVGNFAGLSLYDPSNPPQTYDSRASTLLARTADGDLRRIGATDDGGSISAICQSPDKIVFVGGNFTSMGGVAAANIAGYNSSSEMFFALGDGLKGEVRTLSCNGTTVYAGGEFTGSMGGPNVAAWSTSQKAWTDLPLYGFNGAVESIQPSQDGRSLFFGGAFSTTFSNSSSAGPPASSSSSPSSTDSFPSLGSSLTPISLNSSDYWASPTTWESGFGRPQYIFCPRHADGVGASWLLVDGQAGFFIARMYRQLNVRGIRLGNTFYEGRGTKNFSVVSIPDDQVLELTYASDPSDPSSPLVTCSSDCPLAHNASVPYQDFLFPEGTSLTGFQLNIFGWYGAGGGLHLLQLLSEGSYAYAVADDNLSPCANGLGASTQASVSTSGPWTKTSVTTSIAGTTQEVLVANVEGGSGTKNAPSITWQPYVAEPGQYAVYFVTPGCTQAGTCGQRTSVLVTATPKGGSANETTVDQTNAQDQSTLIYNGTLDAGADSLSVKMTLAPNGALNAGTTYQIVADYVNLVAASTNGSSVRIERGFGLYEYPLVDSGAFGDAVPTAQATSVNASSTLTNATGLDAVSFRLDQGAVVNSIVTVGTGSDAQVFIGGNFTFSNNSQVSHNVLAYKLDQVIVAPNGGLNGNVNSLVELNGAVYAAGTFTASQDNAVSGLRGVAKWNYSSSTSKAWEPLGNVPSVGGTIQQLAAVGSGDNAAIVAAGAGGSGLAFYNPASSSWNSTAAGLFLGNLTAVGTAAAPTSSNATTYLAGNILAAVKNGAPGGAVLSSDKHGIPQLSSFGFGFNGSSSLSNASAASSKSTASRRALIRKSAPRLALEPRAQPASSVNLTLPSPIQAIAATGSGDQLLAGAFWKNGSTNLMLVGGSFASSAGVANLGAYDTKAQTLSALPGESVTGTVTTLDVIGDTLWVGGNFTTVSGRQGFTTYDLQHTTPDDSQPPLSGWAGTNATVNAIAQRPGYDDQVIVAGAFASAGSLYCASVCLWDNKKLQWSSLATGLQGVVGAIDFAGDKSEYLIAAGNFILNGETRYIARWSFKNSTWLSLGAANDLPGPATAVSADDHNEDKVFVAGSSTSGTLYLRYWNGTTWSDITNNTLGAGSGIQQLAFVPLSNNHAANKVVESDRMLLVSGVLQINNTAVSSALYDGESWYPYLIATSATGSAGIIAKLFYSVSNFSLSGGHHLAAGLVILISIAIGLGLVFLLVLIGLLIALARRKDEPQYPPPDARRGYESGTETSSINGLHRPNSLLQTVGAATAVLLDPKGEKAVDHDSLNGGAAGGSLDDGALGYGSDYGDDAEPSTALARYSFHAEHPGELTISTNEQLTILESSDPNWWMVANSQGQRGLVPLSYLA
ncbi:hypothetical protein NBRC10512v2_004420 [Rhodotorula toruloides]